MKALINIDVDNLLLATDFYTRAFNLRIGRRFGDEGVELLGFDLPIYLLLNKEGSQPFTGATQGRFYSRHWTPVHIDVAVENIESALKQVREAGATVESELIQRAWGKMVLLSDPFGHGWCILEFNDKGYDAITTA